MTGVAACLLTNFGAPGHLARRMPLPSLYLLQGEGLLKMPISHGLCRSIEAIANADQVFDEGRVFRGRVGGRPCALVIRLQPDEQGACSPFPEAAASSSWRVAA